MHIAPHTPFPTENRVVSASCCGEAFLHEFDKVHNKGSAAKLLRDAPAGLQIKHDWMDEMFVFL